MPVIKGEFALSSIWFSLTGTFKEIGNSYDVTLTTPSSESFKSEKPSSKCCEFLNGQVGNISVKKLYLSFKLKKICSTSSKAVDVSDAKVSDLEFEAQAIESELSTFEREG